MMSSMSPYDKRDPKAMDAEGIKRAASEYRGTRTKNPRLNSKQVSYCIERSNGKTKAEAYAIAYRDLGSTYKNGKLGSMLEARSAFVREHIATLIQARSDVVNIAVRDAAKELGINKKFIFLELLETLRLARTKGHFSLVAANRAIELMGKEIGMFITRVEVDRKQTLDEFLDALDLPKEDYKRIESKPQEPGTTILQ